MENYSNFFSGCVRKESPECTNTVQYIRWDIGFLIGLYNITVYFWNNVLENPLCTAESLRKSRIFYLHLRSMLNGSFATYASTLYRFSLSPFQCVSESQTQIKVRSLETNHPLII